MALPANPADEAAMQRKGAAIHAKLSEVYPEAPQGFLDHSDAFTLLVAVLLSAQSLDKKVNAVTPALFREAGTPAAMRRLGETRIRALIREVGLSPQKAANLAKLSAKIEDEFDGQVPRSFAQLESLPGVGHKTAAVVMVQAFGHPAFPVDTHIHRLACRWGAGDAKSVERTEQALMRWFPDPHTWHALHTRIILFGREHCPARKHDMETCPVCSFAATDEARAANAASPNKFVPAQAHKHPFAMRGVDAGAEAAPDGGEDAGAADASPRPARKKRAAVRAKKTGDGGSDDDLEPTAAKKKRRAAAKRKQPEAEEQAVDNEAGEGSTVAGKAAAKRKRKSSSKKGGKTGAGEEAEATQAAPAGGRAEGGATETVRTSARIRARREAGK